jgi:hypothetical protein
VRVLTRRAACKGNIAAPVGSAVAQTFPHAVALQPVSRWNHALRAITYELLLIEHDVMSDYKRTHQ